jgi:nitrogen regulatory protein PII
MKCLTVIIHEAAKQKLVDTLLETKEVEGFTVLTGEGHSPHAKRNPFETKRDLVTGFVPRIRVDILLSESSIERIVSTLAQCDSCVEGTGLYWVSDISATGRF